MPLSSPVIELNTLQDVFEATLEYELLITKECEELASEALKLNNHILYSLALKYCKEQQEEIGKAITNLDILALSNDMLIIDNYIGETLLD